MSYELFEQGPEAYIPVLLLSLVITVLAYGAFPFIFAKKRNTPITKKKYKRLCYGINFAIMVLFIAINGAPANGAPYVLWTWIFSNFGIKILSERDVMTEGEYVSSEEESPIETDKIQFCRRCGEKLIDGSRFCRKCGTEIVEEPVIIVSEPDNCEFCKKCGADITDDIDTCHVCGEQKDIV